VTGLLGLPLMPIRGVVWLGEQILAEAEGQLHDPARVCAQLQQVDEARRRGELSDEESAAIENELLERLLHRPA
jgi:hypothetical protein